MLPANGKKAKLYLAGATHLAFCTTFGLTHTKSFCLGTPNSMRWTMRPKSSILSGWRQIKVLKDPKGRGAKNPLCSPFKVSRACQNAPRLSTNCRNGFKLTFPTAQQFKYTQVRNYSLGTFRIPKLAIPSLSEPLSQTLLDLGGNPKPMVPRELTSSYKESFPHPMLFHQVVGGCSPIRAPRL